MLTKRACALGLLVLIASAGGTASGQVGANCSDLTEAACARRTDCIFLKPTRGGVALPGYCAPAAGPSPSRSPTTADLVLVAPTEGCPARLPSHEAAEEHCLAFEQASCGSAPLCTWAPPKKDKDGVELLGSCAPKPGMFVAEPSAEPAVLLGMGPIELARVTRDEGAEKLAKSAHDAAASKQFDRAISLYTQAAKKQPENGAYLFRRALVHDNKRDPARALDDYCAGLAVGLDWQDQELSRRRVAAISKVTTDPVPVPLFMNSGILRMRSAGARIAKFKVEGAPDADHVIKLVRGTDGREDMMVYVKAGTTFETKVSVGTYYLRGASGHYWFGTDDMFGEATRFYRIEANGLNQSLDFSRSGNKVSGWTIRLTAQAEGNIQRKTIDKKDF